MNDIYRKLKDKGWNDEDINKAALIIKNSEIKKSKKLRFLDDIIFWIVLIIAIIGNLIISIILIPFLLALKGYILYSIIIIIGISFGFFFDLLIRDIEKLEKKNIIISGLFIPAIAIINISYMVRFANYIQSTLQLGNVPHSYILVSLVYAAAFMLPYLSKEFILKSKSLPKEV